MSNSTENEAFSELSDFDEDLKNEKTEDLSLKKVFLFKDFNLDLTLLENIKNNNFENPSPVQSLAIPKILLKKDILCQAKSGTGKTAVFVITTIQKFINNREKSLVIAHTHELCEQIRLEYKRFSVNIGINISENIYHENDDIVITTLSGLGPLGLDHFSNLIIDECDFIINNKLLIDLIKNFKNKSILMFTATLTKNTKKNCLSFLKDPFEIYVDDNSELNLHGLKQYFIETSEKNKLNLIKKLIKIFNNKKIIIFCKRVQNALYLEDQIKFKAFTNFMAIGKRIETLNKFKEKDFLVLATTNILSRGIDIQNVEVVINFDMPDNPQTYLHRVGRAGRFESEGVAVNFISNLEDKIRMNEIMTRYEINIKRYEFKE